MEQSCVIWHSSLTQENSENLERVQKNAFRIILGNQYDSYEESLKYLHFETLSTRREKLAIKFAQNCVQNSKTMKLFKLRKTIHKQTLRKQQKYRTIKANTKRMGQSAVPYLRKLLNRNLQKK